MTGKTWFLFVLLCTILCLQVIAQGGNTCPDASSAPLNIPFNLNNQSTCGDGNDYTGANGCLPASWGNAYGGQDWLYSFTPSTSGFINILLDDVQASGTAYPTMSLYEGCPGTPNACLITSQGSSWNNAGITIVYPVQAGVQYFIGIDAYTVSNYYANCFQFDLEGSLITEPVQPACTNMDFNDGNLNGWIATTGNSVTGPVGAITPTYSITGIGVVNGRHTIMTGGNDPCAGFPRVDPLGGPSSVRLGNSNTGADAEQLRQTFMVSPSNSSFTYRYAVVFEDPGHTSREQPFFRALLRDQNGDVVPCSDFVVSAAASLPGFFSCTGNVRYKPWSTVNVDLSNYLGQPVTVEFTAGDCSQGGHYGYAYIDAQCAPSTLAALADTICPGESVTLTAPDGYATYNWQPGNINSQSITVAPAASTVYTLNLTAFNGCTSTFQVPITVAPIPVASFTYQAPACDLPVQLQADNNEPGATYFWNLAPSGVPGTANQAVVNANFPGPGSYPVTLSLVSGFGCSDTITQNIVVPPCVFRVTITGDTICPGECLDFPVSMNYGVAPYTYNWSTGSSDPSITVCSNQNQLITVTVTDADGYIATDTAMITIVPDVIFSSLSSNLSCYESQDGSIEANAIGWGPFDYLWNQGSTSPEITSLSVGNYSLEVTDRFGCMHDTNFVITQPAELSFQVETIAATCNLANASLEITQVSGGTPAYLFSLNGAVGSINSIFNGLNPGSYTVIVSDANLCSDSTVISLTSISYPTLVDFQTIDATCSQSNGTVQINGIVGGVEPYSISFNGNTPQTMELPATFDSLPEDNYQISITDSNGCSVDTTTEILQFAGPTAIELTVVDGTCNLSNGSISIDNVTEGISPYEFSLNGGNYSNLSTYNNLTPGNFNISVRDSNQCVLDTNIAVLSIPSIVVVAIADANPSCFGFNNGQAHAEIIQGDAPFTFSWSSGQNDSLITSLLSGTYIVTAIDANSCEHRDTLVITEPAILQFSIDEQNPICGFANGIIEVDSAFGGTAPYSFRLDSSAWSSNMLYSSLNDGVYEVFIRDSQQCQDSRSTTLATPSFPSLMTTEIVDAVCAENNGEIAIQTIIGGTAPLSLAFNDTVFNPVSAFPESFSNLSEGNYMIQVKDANNCMLDSLHLIIRYPGPSALTAETIDATCSLNNSVIAITGIEGGTAPFMYSFNGAYPTSDTLYTDLPPGSFTVAVTDINGCSIDSLIQTLAIPDVSITTQMTQSITCYGYSNGAIMAEIPTGTAPFAISWSNGANGILADSLPFGNYTATVVDSNGCTANSSMYLSQPEEIHLFINAPDYVCEGKEIILQAGVEGGTGHLDITWPAFSHSGEILIDTPDSSTTYVALGTDVLGCQDVDSTSILMRLSPSGTIIPDETEGCSPVCVNFTFDPSSTASIGNYQWTFEGYNNSQESVPKHCFTEAGSQDVSVLIEDVYGCEAIISAEGAVEVHPLPQARFRYTPDEVDVMDPVFRFINESDLADSFYWTFGDGFFSLVENPEHEFSDTGSYSACLKVSTIFGCEDFTCKNLDVDPYPTIYAPNAFTPNGDGTNDVFQIKLTYVNQFLLEIFDRWGELLYTSSDPNNGWDGTYKGNPAQEDVYVWRVTYTNILRKSDQLIGRVTLIE